jgi:hypothetical protein
MCVYAPVGLGLGEEVIDVDGLPQVLLVVGCRVVFVLMG